MLQDVKHQNSSARWQAFPVKRSTYTRIYQAFGDSGDVRAALANATPKQYKKIGEDYSFTPLNRRDGRPFSLRPTEQVGGGFFLKLHKLKGPESGLFSIEYALIQFSSQFENLTGMPFAEIYNQYSAYHIEYILHQYFVCVDEPKDGDFVLYRSRDGI